MLVNVSAQTLIKIAAFIIAAIFLFLARQVIFGLLVALILAWAINPWMDYWEKRKIPRSISITFVFIAFFAIIMGLLYLLIPTVTSEISTLINEFPAYWQKINTALSGFMNFSVSHDLYSKILDYLNNINSVLTAAIGHLANAFISLIGGLFFSLFILAAIFFLTVGDKKIKNAFISWVPAGRQSYVSDLLGRIQEKVGLWLRGQLILSVIMFFLAWLGLTVLGVKYSLTLALLAGFAEFVPYFGALISGIPAVFFAGIQSPLLGLITLIMYICFHFAEAYFIMPKVVQKAVGLNPVALLAAMLIGEKLAGPLGVVLAAPVMTIIAILVKDYQAAKEK